MVAVSKLRSAPERSPSTVKLCNFVCEIALSDEVTSGLVSASSNSLPAVTRMSTQPTQYCGGQARRLNNPVSGIKENPGLNMSDAANIAHAHWNTTPLLLSERERYEDYAWL